MTEASIIIEDSPSADKIIKIVHVSGQLDESNIDEKIKDVYKLVEENPKALNLLFDLANLEYMNSKSIGYMTDLYGKITESGGQVVIAMARPNIIDILQVVGLTQLITIYDSIDEAKNHLISNSSASNLAGATDVAPVTPEAVPVTASIPTSAPVTAPMATAPVATPTVSPTNVPQVPTATATLPIADPAAITPQPVMQPPTNPLP